MNLVSDAEEENITILSLFYTVKSENRVLSSTKPNSAETYQRILDMHF